MKKQNTKTIMLLILYTAAVIFFFINLNWLLQIISFIIGVINPIIYGFVIAYVLFYPYKLFYNHAFKAFTKKKFLSKIRKPLAITVTYILVFGIISILISLLIPELSTSISKFIESMPQYEATIRQWADDTAKFIERVTGYDLYEVATFNSVVSVITGSEATDFFKDLSTLVIPSAFSTLVDIGTILYNWGLGIVISIYMLSNKDKLLSQSRRVVTAYTPEKFHKRVFKIVDVFNLKCGKFIVGKIIDSTIIGLMCFIGMSIFRFDYPLLISVFIGVSNLIPFFGPIIGAIPSALLLLLINPMEALWFVIFIIVLQQFDGNILGPKILGESVGVSGFWIMISVIVGGGLFGIPGMLLGVPIFAAIYVLVQEGTERRLKKKAAKKAAEAAAAESVQNVLTTDIPAETVPTPADPVEKTDQP